MWNFTETVALDIIPRSTADWNGDVLRRLLHSCKILILSSLRISMYARIKGYILLVMVENCAILGTFQSVMVVKSYTYTLLVQFQTLMCYHISHDDATVQQWHMSFHKIN